MQDRILVSATMCHLKRECHYGISGSPSDIVVDWCFFDGFQFGHLFTLLLQGASREVVADSREVVADSRHFILQCSMWSKI